MARMTRPLLLVLMMLVACWSVEAQATCNHLQPNFWIPGTPSQADVQECVTLAATTGDVILVPPGTGTVTWGATGPITINGKCLTLQGPGAGSLTVFNGSPYSGGLNWMIDWTTTSTGNGLCRITGFTFDGNSKTASSNQPMLRLTGNTAKMRVDQNIFYIDSLSIMHFRNFVRGVVDHNAFHGRGNGIMVYVFHDQWNNNANGCIGTVSNGCGDASFAAPTNLGGSDYVYFEDNTYDINGRNKNGGAVVYGVDGWAGGRYVMRWNTTTDVVFANHGTETANRSRSFRSAEIYNNTFHAATTGFSGVWGFRGGTGIVFQNRMTANYPVTPGFIGGAGQLTNDNYFRNGCAATPGDCSSLFWRSDPMAVTITSSGTTATATTATNHFLATNAGSGITVTANITGNANFNGRYNLTYVSATTFTFTFAGCGGCSGSATVNSAWDQTNTGYPALDMPGRGQGDLIGSGANPSAGWPNQALEPIYAWTNRKKNGTDTETDAASVVGDGTAFNRDWYDYTATFNGTTGVGKGIRANRPATCTAGVAYWSTDQGSWNASTTETISTLFGYASGQDGVLDRCTATNTWTNAWFTPYSYPHPLTGVSADNPPGPPSTPTGLTISRLER